MKKLFLIAIACLAVMMPANAQILKRIGESAARAAESTVSNQINRKIDEGIDDAFNKNKKNKNKDAEQAEEIDDEEEATSQSSKKSKAKQPRTIEAAYSKCDFVPGDEIIFDDDLVGEQLGEFPSKWDLIGGVSEVVKFDGKMALDFQDNTTRVAPLMKNPRNYLTDEFTVECDFFAGDNSTIKEGLYSRSHYRMDFISEADGRVMEFYWHTADVKNVQCWYTSTTGDGRSSEADISALLVDGEWNHLSISFNKRAFKAYINGTRVINIPNMKAPNYLEVAKGIFGVDLSPKDGWKLVGAKSPNNVNNLNVKYNVEGLSEAAEAEALFNQCLAVTSDGNYPVKMDWDTGAMSRGPKCDTYEAYKENKDMGNMWFYAYGDKTVMMTVSSWKEELEISMVLTSN